MRADEPLKYCLFLSPPHAVATVSSPQQGKKSHNLECDKRERESDGDFSNRRFVVCNSATSPTAAIAATGAIRDAVAVCNGVRRTSAPPVPTAPPPPQLPAPAAAPTPLSVNRFTAAGQPTALSA